jgi:hypothetical protein
MKHPVRIATHIVSAIVVTLLTTQNAAAQTSTSASPPQNAQTTDSAQAGVNPMTGRTLLEEDLHRQLNKSKLITQLGQEQVKQAQNSADLALANLRVEAERTRARAESLAQLPVLSPARPSGLTPIKPLQVPTNISTPRQNSAIKPNNMGQASVPMDVRATTFGSADSGVRAPSRPSGTIQIGGETLEISSGPPQAPHAQIQWVDSQARQVARAGSPLQPINVPPATGVLGIPPIPGIMPSVFPPNQSQ